jgi:hypothetical protein
MTNAGGAGNRAQCICVDGGADPLGGALWATGRPHPALLSKNQAAYPDEPTRGSARRACKPLLVGSLVGQAIVPAGGLSRPPSTRNRPFPDSERILSEKFVTKPFWSNAKACRLGRTCFSLSRRARLAAMWEVFLRLRVRHASHCEDARNSPEHRKSRPKAGDKLKHVLHKKPKPGGGLKPACSQDWLPHEDAQASAPAGAR